MCCNVTRTCYSIALTKLDILDIFDEVKIGVKYIVGGKQIDTYPGALLFVIY